MATSVPLIWNGETVVCIASGPSLTQEDVDYVRGRARVIVVNNGYQMAPWADCLWATDASWWRAHKGVSGFHGMKYSAKLTGNYPSDVKLLKCHRGAEGQRGIAADPGWIQHGKNGGHAAINLAVHFGASKIVLLGYDCQLGPSREQHWHRNHAQQMGMPFPTWLRNFQSLVRPLAERGIKIVNCSRRTAIRCFPQKLLTEVFPMPLEAAS